MSDLFGHTRARIAARHALITPGNHVNSSVPGITGATTVILINEAMGAKFAQVQVTFTAEGRAAQPASGTQTFGYVMHGGGALTVGKDKAKIHAGGYFYVPAGLSWSLTAPKAGTQLTLFQKKYAALPGVALPKAIIGDVAKVKGTPFLGDPAHRNGALVLIVLTALVTLKTKLAPIWMILVGAALGAAGIA